MRCKLDQVRLSAATFALNYDVIILTETWINNSVHDSEIDIGPYIIYRDDRSETVSSRGGGILIAINKSLLSKSFHSFENDLLSFNQLFVILPELKIIIGSVYLPPASDISLYHEHVMHVEDILSSYLDHDVFLMGDYNLPGISWKMSSSVATHSVEERSTSSTRYSAALLTDSFNSLGLSQFNLFTNSKGNILDLCFSNLNSKIILSNDILSKIDEFHPVLNISLNCANSTRHTPPSFNSLKSEWVSYNFARCNIEVLNQKLMDIDWNSTLCNLEVSSAVKRFYDILLSLIAETCPKKHRNSAGYPSWFSKKLISLLINKKIAHKNYKNNQSEINYNDFKNLRSLCKAEATLCYSTYISNIESNVPNNINIFWNFINAKRGTKGYPSSMFLDDFNGSNDAQISNLFAEFFKKVYSLATTNATFDSDTIANYCTKTLVPDEPTSSIPITISEKELIDALKDLKPSLAIGSDGVPAFIVKNCSLSLIKPLLILFNLSLEEKFLPELWKKSFITPVFKSGSRNNIRNYRPIAIISAIPKLLDKIMYNKILLFCSDAISSKQHGFVHSRSTITNLTLFTNSIFLSLNKNTQLDAIYLDFKKAFDLINHDILLLKLKYLNLPTNLILWIGNYLSKRYSIVRINGAVSQQFLAPSGVPQGSHIGPLLFLLFINDLVNVIQHCNILLFADDIKLFSDISKLSDCNKLQSDLKNLTIWCKANLFFLNFDKCFTISFSKKNYSI